MREFKDLKIAVAGTGYVGLSIATLLSQHHHVTAVDIVPEKVELINNRKSPIQDEYIEKYLAEKELDLTATLDAKEAYSDADFVVIAAPTNYDSKKNFFDTSAVEAVIKLVIEYNPEAIMVIKSTIPVGYTASVREKFHCDNIIFSPEFLRESKALYDNLYPSRIIVGTDVENARLVKAAHTFAELLQEGAIKENIDTLFIYQIDNSEKNREYRCRSYEYQIQHGFMITADNYGTGYSGTASRGMGAEAIRKKMESINPDKFKIRKFGVSDVIGLTAAGKTSFFYVDKDRLVRFNGFFPKPQSGTYLILDEGGYQVAGQKGTWLVSDEVEVDGQRFVQMRSEQTKNPPPSIILHESGAFVTQTALGFDGEATRKMSAFLQGQKPELLHHQKFFENGTAERAKESGTEQNYNMIDGCVNNVPQKPRRIGGRWSVLDRLHIKQAERRQKDNTPQQEQERSRKS